MFPRNWEVIHSSNSAQMSKLLKVSCDCHTLTNGAGGVYDVITQTPG